MPKYKKKPIVIEAFLVELPTKVPQPSWFIDARKNGTIVATPNGYIISTLEGEMTAQKGDYIIQGIKGEIYPCKPDIFEATYEEVQE